MHNDKIYAGYEDGEIVVWDASSDEYEEEHAFDFHKTTITSLCIF